MFPVFSSRVIATRGAHAIERQLNETQISLGLNIIGNILDNVGPVVLMMLNVGISWHCLPTLTQHTTLMLQHDMPSEEVKRQHSGLCSTAALAYPAHTCTLYTCPSLWLPGYGTESKATVSELGVFNLPQSLRACASAHVIHHVDQNMPQTNGASAFSTPRIAGHRG